jgi:hypothetical protein
MSEFMMEWVHPDPAGTASLRELLHARYLPWCESKAKEPLCSSVLGRELRSIVDAIGLKCEPAGDDVIVRGAAQQQQQSGGRYACHDPAKDNAARLNRINVQ